MINSIFKLCCFKYLTLFIITSGLYLHPGNTQTPFWQQTNGPLGGVRVNDVFITPDNEIIIGTAFSGIYYSFDHGSNWINRGLEGLNIRSITKPQGRDLFVAAGGGIYRSSDMGNIWKKVLSLDTPIYTLAINSNGDIFAGGSILDYPGADGKLFRSTDNGLTWFRMESGLSANWVADILILENDYIFLSTGTENINGNAGIYLSKDNGDTWQKTGLNKKIITSIKMIKGGNIYVTSWDSVFCSADTGKTWTPLSDGLSNISIYCITTTPNNNLYAGTSYGVYKLVDSTWVLSSSGLEQNRAFSLASDSSGFLYAGTYHDGIYRSTDDGTNWLPVNSGVFGTNINALLTKPLPDGRIFAGANNNGVFYSDDKGETWVQTSLKNMSIYTITANPQGVIFVGCGGGKGAFCSFDNGLTWESIGLKHTTVNSIISVYNPVILAATFDGIYQSDDNGDSWYRNAFADGIVRNLTLSPQGKIFAFLYLQGDKFLIESNDFGNSWKKVAFEEYHSVLAVNNSGDIFLDGSYNQQLLRSTDNGFSWDQIKISDGDISTYSIVINSLNEIYVSTTNGIYLSIDNGDTWAATNRSFGNRIAKTMAFDPDGYLYAGTSASGVFRSVDPIVLNDHISIQVVLTQNYPNPFNSKTAIHFFLSSKSFISIKIYDLFGREIEKLLDQELLSGYHKIEWDAINLPSNVYFYRLKSDHLVQTKKMILIK